jgi:hypothetical protein
MPVPNSSSASPDLDPVARLTAAAVASLAGLGVWQLLAFPPHLKQAASSCEHPSCVVTVSSTDQTAVIALIALAAAAALIAVLGVRFTKTSVAGASLEGPATVGEVVPKDAAKRTGGVLKVRPPTPPATPTDDEWHKLPGWAQRTLIEWAQGGTVVTTPMKFAVVAAAKDTRAESRAWYVTVKLDDGHFRVLQVK